MGGDKEKGERTHEERRRGIQRLNIDKTDRQNRGGVREKQQKRRPV